MHPQHKAPKAQLTNRVLQTFFVNWDPKSPVDEKSVAAIVCQLGLACSVDDKDLPAFVVVLCFLQCVAPCKMHSIRANKY